MTKTKILLAISLTLFAISLTGVVWGLFLPAGAIIFGLFMIFNALEKESALFDAEQQSRFASADKINRSRSEQVEGGVRPLRVRNQTA